MRLRRLDLTRFGHFTDFSLDFGEHALGKADLHIIFGANESGKTTAFEAYLDVLFGIPVRSQYNFLHDYDNMRVGACLEIDGTDHELVRIKKRQNDLLDANGNPVNPAILARALSGMSREQYRAMFSLDDETIEKGGDDILASHGDLGQLLFSAAAGLSDLSGVLDKAREAAEGFHKSRAQKTYLAEARRNLKALEKEIRDIDLNTTRFRALRQALETAETNEKAARKKRDDLLGDKTRHEAVIECLPLLAERNGLHSDLEAVKDHTVFQEAWPEQARNLREREVAAIAKKSAARDALKILREKQGRIKPNPDILAVRQEIEQLMDAPRSRALTACDDLPKRERELTELNADIEQAMKNLDLTEVNPAHLAEPVLGGLERLANEVETARAALDAARGESRNAREELDEITEGEADERQAILPVDDLRALLDHLQPETLASRYREVGRAARRETRAMTGALANLAPWNGEADQLPAAPMTEDQARRIANEHATQKDEHKEAQKEFDKAARELAGIQARIDTMKTGSGLFADEDKDAARALRDVAWDEHAVAFTKESADKFHEELVRVDTIQDAQLETADRLAQLRGLQLNAADLKAQKAHWKAQTESHAQVLEAKQGEFAAFRKELALPESFDPRDLQPWLKSLAAANTALTTLVQANEDQTRAQTDITKAEAALCKVLNAAPEAGNLSDLARMARHTLEEAGRVEERARAIKAARAKLAKRTQKVEELQKGLLVAEAEWREQADAPPLNFDNPSDFRDALPTLRTLGPWLPEREKLSRRIEAMKKDADDFTKTVRKLNTRLGGGQHAEVFVLAQDLQIRLNSAEQASHDLLILQAQIQEQEAALASAAKELVDVAQAVVEMAQAFPDATGIKTTEDLVRAVSNAKNADELRDKIAQLARRIMLRLGQGDFDSAVEILDDKEIPRVSALLQTVKADLSEAEKTLEGAIGDLRSSGDALAAVGDDDTVARLQEKRQILLLDIAEEARKSLRLRLGILLAEQALTRYRDTHRSGMLADTEKAFTTLTAGRYAKLVTQPDGKNELLLAVRSEDNRSISAAKMSKSTRFQLYLALRLAGYSQFVSGGTTLPFIADDILETFDNTRTSAALALLGEISLSGQALYFTHHEHVVDLARARLGDGCHIHNLSTEQ
ncbi:AAA family ATPase [Rhodobacteraceae bacterium R_SAG10]|nr:AAA family ATPase [Rhodobacteraceae bacterium R_SAG10]